ncbi:hypothetical protein [Streptomyces lavendofoliae]|uniref:hypothetical protein n=1 Tax=Streptomyces lavendofoliae TaxID=67314 RepID=UPI003D8CC670
MDEMRTLQDFRADAPEPGRARLAPGHRRLLDEATRPRRRVRGGWWLAVAGAAAAVTAVAALATLLPSGHRPAPTAVKPRADQWVYRKTEWRTVDCGLSGSGHEGMETLGIDLRYAKDEKPCDLRFQRPRTEEAWGRYDGWKEILGPEVPPAQTASGARHGGAGTDLLTPRQSDSLVEDLPDDTDAALVLIRKRSIPTAAANAWRLTQAQRDFREIAEVLATATTVPKEKGRLLIRTAGKLPGAKLTSTVVPDGRETLMALGVEGNHRDYAWERNTFELLFDPRTQAFRGFRLVAGTGYYVGGKKSGGPYVAKGAVLATAVRVTTAIVDARGARP